MVSVMQGFLPASYKRSPLGGRSTKGVLSLGLALTGERPMLGIRSPSHLAREP